MAMRRVLVRGCSGSGKTTLSMALAERLGVPRVELDALYHQPGWQAPEDDDFRAAVASAVAGDRWVADGNYRLALPVLRERVDTLVWLDLPRALVTRRVVWRTASRLVTREALWNDNRESLRNVLSRDPERSIVRWTWTQWPNYHRKALAAATDPDWAHARTIRLTTPSDVARFLADVPA
ncbi:hypothetical protein [Salsipaludibacter albus]|uniref:hypothetical protein n=1 Tax=Salsipaludibacter albus TaxID=2849650 RepID=UPI00236771E5|nr:hypothetical protein [Salsipaludibacter albus]MBY5161182.1 adenylate kinase [Salsipaludibacter albus]